LLKPSEYRYVEGEGFGLIVITFIVAKKSLIYSLFCSIYGICGLGDWLKTLYGGRGVTENVRIPSYDIGTFP